jgi:peptidoglycan/LPS O-acetylase OafA/YrhL
LEVHPGLDAVFVCAATASILLNNKQFKSNILITFLVGVGNISYSLYLVHWPIFSLVNNIYLEMPGLDLRLMLVALSFVAALILNKLIENPTKEIKILPSYRWLFILISSSIFLVGMSYFAESIFQRSTP